MWNDEKLRAKAQDERAAMRVPEEVHAGIEETLRDLPEQSAEILSVTAGRRWKRLLSVAAALVLTFLLLPNISYPVANALGSLPVIGTVFEAVTFRHYTEETDTTVIDVETPSIKADGNNAAANAVSREIDAMNQEAIARFQEEHAAGGYGSLNITYDVAADTDRWYTVRVARELTGADGAVEQTYYTFDKTTGECVVLSDLFEKDDYIDHLTANVKKQMRAQMKAGTADYFLDTDLPEEDFTEIDPNQEFYFDDKDTLVLCFDEMEVAPASEGAVTFTIPKNVYANDLKTEYR